MRHNPLGMISSNAGLTFGFALFLGLSGCSSDAKEPRGSGQSAAGQTANSQEAKKMTVQVTLRITL